MVREECFDPDQDPGQAVTALPGVFGEKSRLDGVELVVLGERLQRFDALSNDVLPRSSRSCNARPH